MQKTKETYSIWHKDGVVQGGGNVFIDGKLSNTDSKYQKVEIVIEDETELKSKIST